MSNVAYGKRGAKKDLIDKIREGSAYSKLSDKVTTGKHKPASCYGLDPDDKVCATLSPAPKGKHCWPCAKEFQENAKKDMSIANYRTANDWTRKHTPSVASAI